MRNQTSYVEKMEELRAAVNAAPMPRIPVESPPWAQRLLDAARDLLGVEVAK